MMNYLWIYILGTLAFISLIAFWITFSKDHFFIKKLKMKKRNYLLNLTLLLFCFVDIGLIIFLLMSLKEQMNIFGN